MEATRTHREARPPRLGVDYAEEQELGLTDELEMWSQQLHALCGHNETSDDENSGDAASSAADIANECLELLAAMHIDERASAASTTDTAPDEDLAAMSEPALLRELYSVADELQDLMSALVCPPALQKPHDESSETPSQPQSPPRKPTNSHRNVELHLSQIEIPSAPFSSNVASVTMAMCKSPKMKQLTERLQKRQGHYRPPHHRTSRLQSLRLRALATKKRSVDDKPKSLTRRLLDDNTFWRQYQSKSFRQHISRQSKARERQDEERQKQQKAIEYHYRKVSKTCYPLALKRAESITPVRTLPSRSYSAKSPAALKLTCEQPGEGESQPGDNGLLCGVYLYARRRKGMHYLTCSSVDEIKQRVVERFKLSTPVLNLYREQVSKLTPGARSERKYLYRIASFHDIRSGDLLCATTDGYEDMAILCAWMKARQGVVHLAPHDKKFVQKTPQDIKPTAAKIQKRNATGVEESLIFKAPASPEIKLWDENGRLVNICKNLPI